MRSMFKENDQFEVVFMIKPTTVCGSSIYWLATGLNLFIENEQG